MSVIMAKVDSEPGVLEYLFKPKFLEITTHPTQESTSIRNAENATRDLASRIVAFAVFGVIRTFLDPEHKYPNVGYILGIGMILTLVDFGISWAKLNMAQQNYRKDYARLHPDK